MDLKLTVIKHKGQRPEPPLEVVLNGRSGSIGRKDFNDLVLPDPDRFVSSTHARIEYQGGRYYLLDQSTNGTILNHSPQPVDKGKPIPLSDGDILGIGEYEVRVNFLEDLATAPDSAAGPATEPSPVQPTTAPEPPPSPFQSETLDPLALIGGDAAPPATPEAPSLTTEPPVPDPLTPPVAGQPGESALPPEDPLAAVSGGAATGIPDDFDLLAGLSPAEPSQPDHAPIEQQAFTPPEVAPEPPSMPAAPEPPAEQPDVGLGAPVSGSEAMPEPGLPGAAPSAPAPSAAPGATPPAPQPPGSAAPPPPVGEPAAGQQPSPPTQSEPPSAPADAAAPTPAQAAGGQAAAPAAADRLLQALFEGLGQSPGRALTPEEQEALARTLGNLVRLTIDGLIRTLAVRNGFKQELRLEMTTIRPVENNPLKFSINAQDALQRMLFLRQQGFMGPEQAIEEAFHDIMAHEMAMVAGLQAALQALLDRFDPKALEEHFREFGALTGALPLLREAKYWDVFKKTYAQVRRDAEEGFMHLFGEAFNRAYEEQVHRLKTQASSDIGRQT